MANCVAILLLTLHFVTFGCQLLALALFWQTGNIKIFYTSLAALLFTGCFFSDAVWRGTLWSPLGVQVLPIRELQRLHKFCCCCPLVLVCGCLQGVMVPLTLDQHVRIGAGAAGASTGLDGRGATFSAFHGKAVNGLFEGIVCSAVIMYAYLGTNFPAGSPHPVTAEPESYPLKPLGLTRILRLVGLVSFASGGLGILHLDQSICMKLGAYIRSGYSPKFRLFRHWLFRTTELVSRVSLHVFFLLLTGEYSHYWRWLPLMVSGLSSVALMYISAGSEASRSVMWLCGFLCTFVDIFRFIDSPYKRRAARRISRLLAVRHVIEVVCMPLLAVVLMSTHGRGLDVGCAKLRSELLYLLHKHPLVMCLSALSVPTYFLLLCSMGVQRFMDREKDIFAACRDLDVDEVKRLALGGLRVDVNCYDNEGRTPLTTALMDGGLKSADGDKICAEICGILLEGGAKINLQAPIERIWIRRCMKREARFRWTPLHIAARRGSFEILRKLVEEVEDSSDQVFQDKAGNTPLHVAVSFKKKEAVRCLAGRFPEWHGVRNRSGKTPRDLAQEVGLAGELLETQEALISGASEGPFISHTYSVVPWAVEEHEVARITGTGTTHRAPGLCSYVVAAGGGPAMGSVLRLQSNSRDFSQIPEEGQPQLPRSWTTVAGSQTAEPSPVLNAEQLEPIGKKSGAPCREWLENLEKMARDVDTGYLVGRISQRGFCREAVLGKGAYGEVWLARKRGQEGHERFAVKNIKGGSSRVARRECEMCDRVRIMPHPCLVKLYGVQDFIDHDLCVLVMEFIPCGDLLEAIQSGWGEDRTYHVPENAVPWLAQIFLALEHLNVAMHVLLRDLKPANVVLDRNNRAKLIDLGLGRIGTQSDGAFTLTSSPPGTPGYCAPEVLKEQPYDAKADIYSFGVTAWMLLSGGMANTPPGHPPMPPTDFDGNRITSCFNDCYRLHGLINKTSPEGEQNLTDAAARAFILRLTAIQPQHRLNHEQVRPDSFWACHLPVPMPKREEGVRGVEEWLANLGFA